MKTKNKVVITVMSMIVLVAFVCTLNKCGNGKGQGGEGPCRPQWEPPFRRA